MRATKQGFSTACGIYYVYNMVKRFGWVFKISFIKLTEKSKARTCHYNYCEGMYNNEPHTILEEEEKKCHVASRAAVNVLMRCKNRNISALVGMRDAWIPPARPVHFTGPQCCMCALPRVCAPCGLWLLFRASLSLSLSRLPPRIIYTCEKRLYARRKRKKKNNNNRNSLSLVSERAYYYWYWRDKRSCRSNLTLIKQARIH